MTSPTIFPQGHATRDELIQQNIPLVGHLVREAMGRVPAHVSMDDLSSAGLTALVQAAQAYDPHRGVAFAGYAATRIRGAIVDELRGMDWASRSVRRRARQLDQVRDQLTGQLGRTPTDPEIASALGVEVSAIKDHQEDLARAVVMSLQGFDDHAMDDVLPARTETPADVLEHRERLAYLRDAVDQLPEKLRIVVEGYFFAERPMAEIAAELGVTESRVSQLRAEAVSLMRDALNTALDPDLVAPAARPTGVAARRREAYFASVASHRSFAARLGQPAPVVTPHSA